MRDHESEFCLQCGWHQYHIEEMDELIPRKAQTFITCRTKRHGLENRHYGARLPSVGRA